MSARFKDLFREAFNAKPLGMFIPPNWIGLASFGMLGVLNPGFWLVGAGLEWAYLHFLISNGRFQNYVASLGGVEESRSWQQKIDQLSRNLSAADQQRFQTLEKRCGSILKSMPDFATQSASLNRLLWIYLNLLQTRATLTQIIAGADGSPAGKIKQIESQLKVETDETLRRSLQGQLDILHQRVSTQKQGRDKIEFLDSELSRLEEQVELIREQSLLGSDPEGISRRIDEVTATLGGATQWMREQQQNYQELENILVEPPPISTQSIPS